MTGLRTNVHLDPHNRQCECAILIGKRGIWPWSQASTPRSYNVLTAQGTAYRRNRRHLRDTQGEWKEQSSNDGINDDLEDAHPGAIPQPESPVAICHTQRVEASAFVRACERPHVRALVGACVCALTGPRRCVRTRGCACGERPLGRRHDAGGVEARMSMAWVPGCRRHICVRTHLGVAACRLLLLE